MENLALFSHSLAVRHAGCVGYLLYIRIWKDLPAMEGIETKEPRGTTTENFYGTRHPYKVRLVWKS